MTIEHAVDPGATAGTTPDTGAEPADACVIEPAPLHGERHAHTTPDGMPDRAPGERVDLPITGMTCAACARRIETKLGRAPGVRRAAVNFATSRATVEYDPASTGTRQLVGVVEDVGYGVAGTARADFVVDDSARPSGSAQPLEQRLTALPGVVEATFNLGTMQVRAEYLPNAIDVARIRREVEGLGYRVRETPGAGGDAAAVDTEAEARAEEVRDLRRKFWVAAVLSLPVLVIAMSHGRVPAFNHPWITWLQLALTTPVVLYSGRQFYRGAWAAFRHRAADMNTLIAIGTAAAYLYSLAATVAPRTFAGAAGRSAMSGISMPGMSGMPAGTAPVYFEAASVIIALILLGRRMEARAKGQTSDAIRRLAGLQAKTARVVRLVAGAVDGASRELD
ncbi:MAG TPA: cation transporter, partial [Gemmatirosa sp.]